MLISCRGVSSMDTGDELHEAYRIGKFGPTLILLIIERPTSNKD